MCEDVPQMPSPRESTTHTATDFWNREILLPTHDSWMQHESVRIYINMQVGGGIGTWPFDWLESVLGIRRFDRALSVGCGAGALERDLIRRKICRRVDAFDGSFQSIRIARSEAVSSAM